MVHRTKKKAIMTSSGRLWKQVGYQKEKYIDSSFQYYKGFGCCNLSSCADFAQYNCIVCLCWCSAKLKYKIRPFF